MVRFLYTWEKWRGGITGNDEIRDFILREWDSYNSEKVEEDVDFKNPGEKPFVEN
jgi:hypothetical protein